MYTLLCPLITLNPSSFSSSHLLFTFQFNPPLTLTLTPSKFPNKTSSHYKIFHFNYRPLSIHCTNTDSTLLGDDENQFNDDNDDDDDDVEDGCVFTEEGDGLVIEIEKIGRNSRRIRSKIVIDASLDTVWNILTDYEKLSDFIPGLAISKVVDKKDNFARVYQIGQQNLAFGVKFNAKGVLDCFEKDLEISPSRKKRDIEFKMIEGDFQTFKGKWSIEQCNKRFDENDSSPGRDFQTTLSYLVDVKPKIWLPVRLVEGRLAKEIKTNLSCVREEAHKWSQTSEECSQ